MALKHALVRTLNRYVLARHRLVLRKSGYEGDNYVLSPEWEARLCQALAKATTPYLINDAGLLSPDNGTAVLGMIEDFQRLYRRRPITDNTGGMGFNGSLWLYLMVRLLNPRLIIESGTWQGHTSWLMAEACPEAKIRSYDIDPKNLLVRHPRVTYRQGDWTGHEAAALDPDHSLLVFDDHISHARRLQEAAARGFRSAIFDDNVPAGSLFVTGDPPAPTLAMLTDDTWQPEHPIRWRYRGRDHSFVGSAEDRETRALITQYAPVPPLGRASPYREHLGLALVRLA